MINNLLSFGAKSVNPELLEKTLTTRKKIVDEIEASCVEKVLKNATYQSLIIAPRGSGKTHVIKVLYHRLKGNKDISSKSVIAYMSEDEVGIADFTDLMINIFRAFIRYEEPKSEMLNAKIEEAADISNKTERISHIKRTLNDFADGRIIILLIENFDNILNALGKKGQAELRDFMHEYNNLSIIATSQNLIKSLQDSKYPFYNFFSVHQLKKLTYEETSAFFRQIATAENHTGLLEEMDKPEFEGKIRAIYELTEGNHRLLVTFYSFLKAEFKSEFSNVFVKVMNDLKPYYEQFVNALGPQQQKIVKFLSQNRRAVSGKEIARSCFIEPNTLSKQTSILFEQRMIDKSKSGKDVFYELKEPLMRISFEIGDNPHGIATLFVEFLSSFYAAKEIGSKFLEFRYGAQFQKEHVRSKYLNEAELYRLALTPELRYNLLEKEDDLQNVQDIKVLYEKINQLSESWENKNDTSSNLKNILEKIPNFETKFKITIKDFITSMSNNIFVAPANCFEVIEELSGSPESEISDFISVIKKGIQWPEKYFGVELATELKEHVQNSEIAVLDNYDLLKKLAADKRYENNSPINFWLARKYLDNKEYKNAEPYLINLVNLDSESLLRTYNLGLKYYLKEDFKTSIKIFKIALSREPNNLYFLQLIGAAYLHEKKYTKALNHAKAVLKITPNDVSNLGILSASYYNLNKTEEALSTLKKALKLESNNEMSFALKFIRLKATIKVNDFNQFKTALNQFLKDSTLSPNANLFEDLLLVLFMRQLEFNSNDKFLAHLFTELHKLNKQNLVWDSLPIVTSKILEYSENSSLQKMEELYDNIHKTLSSYPQSIIPLKLLSVGIDYLVKGNKNALFDLSKEERKVFQENVLDVIEKNKKSVS